MTVVLTHSVLALSVKPIKIVVNTQFAVTCLTYYWFEPLEEKVMRISTYNTCE